MAGPTTLLEVSGQKILSRINTELKVTNSHKAFFNELFDNEQISTYQQFFPKDGTPWFSAVFKNFENYIFWKHIFVRFFSYLKVDFFQKVQFDFSNLPKKIFKSLSWAGNLNELYTFVGGKFKFQVQDSDIDYFF